nr:MAG TPA: hypothetical protein [Caudoviricetes sp.]
MAATVKKACTFISEYRPIVTRNTGQRATTVSCETIARPVSMVATPKLLFGKSPGGNQSACPPG